MQHTQFLRPVITEKSMDLATHKWYTFKVDLSLSKQDIARVIEEQFKVHVLGVRTITVHGKPKRTGKKRVETQITNWKKALVKVGDKDKIDLFSVEEAPKAK